jgi:hypothetical protein
LRQALVLAERHDVPTVALRVRFSLDGAALACDPFPEAVNECQRGLALARERGDQALERDLLSQLIPALLPSVGGTR